MNKLVEYINANTGLSVFAYVDDGIIKVDEELWDSLMRALDFRKAKDE